MKLFLHGKSPKKEKLKMQQILLKSRFEALAYKYDGRTICESEYSRLPKNTDLGFIFAFYFKSTNDQEFTDQNQLVQDRKILRKPGIGGPWIPINENEFKS